MVNRIYLDTSIAVHALRGTPEAESWFDQIAVSNQHELVSSRLLQTELTRVLRRDGLPVQHREVVLQSVAQTPITEAILTTAEALTDRLKTLDAIHLASALAFGGATTIATHDQALKAAADTVGLNWTDPLDSVDS